MSVRLTLTARLTLLFAAGSSAVLLALGGLTGALIERHFEELDRDALEGQLMRARHLIEAVDTPAELARLPERLSDALNGHHDFMVRVIGPQREVLVDAAVTFPVDATAPAIAATPARLFAWSQDARHYRGLAAAVPTALPGRQVLQVAVAMDTAHHEDFMASIARTLWLFVGGAALLTGLLGWLAASRGLAPLRAMRERASQVTAQKLNQRLNADAVPAELADLATTLNAMLARLEEAFVRLSDFSSDLAHELRTPISNLMTQTQVALSRPREAADYREILESNAEEYERLARMIADMLFLAKAENGLALARRETVDLAQETRALFEFYEALAGDQSVQLVLHGQGQLQGDRLMLRRALSNLLSNALRHSPRGGCVTVTLIRDCNGLTVGVGNIGEAIATEQQDRLFERFYRTDASRQHSGGEGTGLGLAITQAIARAHGARVGVRCDAGQTLFFIHFPSLPDTAPDAE